jgi:phosphatidylglycerophosphatase GEP4
VAVADISALDWRALRAAGFRGVVFDKDNTLTSPYAKEVHPPLRAALAGCLEAFGGAAVLLRRAAQALPRGWRCVRADALTR